MYKVSVVMPIHNNEATLRHAVESILYQSSFDFELILIDDGSTDSSAQICMEYAKKEPLIIQYFQQKHHGLAHARNRGLNQAEGSYVYFANPENIFAPRMLETNVRLAEEKNAELVVFGFVDPDDEVEKIPKMPLLLTKDRFRNHYRNFHYFYPYKLCNKLYQVRHLKERGIHFLNVPFKEKAFFNVDVYRDLSTVVFNRQVYCKRNDAKDGEVSRYQEKQWDVQLYLIDYLKEMFMEWQLIDEYDDVVLREYYQLLSEGVLNLSSPELALSKQELEQGVERLLYDERISDIYTTRTRVTTKSLYERALWNNFRKRNTRVIINLIQQKKQTDKYTQKIKDRFTKWFTN